MDLMEARRHVLMDQPHSVTLSDGLVHFQTDMDGLMQITGTGNVMVCGKNLFDEVYTGITDTLKYMPIYIGGGTVTMSTTAVRWDGAAPLFLLPGNVSTGASTNSNGVWKTQTRTVTAVNGYITIGYRYVSHGDTINPTKNHTQIEIGSAATAYEAYNGTTAAAGTPRKSLVGINNVWSDSGNITVTYWTH